MPKNTELREKLKQKLHEKKLERTSKVVRNNIAESLEEKLKSTKNPKERKKLKGELSLLEKIDEKEINSFTGEYPEYN